MRSVYSKSAKRNFILTQLVLLTAVLFSILLPQRGLTFDGSKQAQSSSGGYAYFSSGVYSRRYTSYTYNVYSAPPNVCGTLYIRRNGNDEVTPNWICTDAYGQATKGPWTVALNQNQTGENIYIQWPDGSTTVGGDYKVDDGSDPIIGSDQSGGFGVPIPSQFNGSASDTEWGTGFNFGPGGWSTITATFQNVTTGKYYNGHNYISDSSVPITGTASPAIGFNITWSVTPPPQSAHNSYDDYEWCVHTNDYFYSTAPQCIDLFAPR